MKESPQWMGGPGGQWWQQEQEPGEGAGIPAPPPPPRRAPPPPPAVTRCLPASCLWHDLDGCPPHAGPSSLSPLPPVQRTGRRQPRHARPRHAGSRDPRLATMALIPAECPQTPGCVPMTDSWPSEQSKYNIFYGGFMFLSLRKCWYLYHIYRVSNKLDWF